jgi:CrcB protein
MKNSLIVFLGSGLGGVVRHLMNQFLTGIADTKFPWSILAINVTGSTALGFAVGWFAFRGHASAELRLFLTTGILGGYTTFSAFSLDAVLLYEHGLRGLAAAYVIASVMLSVIGLFAGLWAIRS